MPLIIMQTAARDDAGAAANKEAAMQQQQQQIAYVQIQKMIYSVMLRTSYLKSHHANECQV